MNQRAVGSASYITTPGEMTWNVSAATGESIDQLAADNHLPLDKNGHPIIGPAPVKLKIDRPVAQITAHAGQTLRELAASSHVPTWQFAAANQAALQKAFPELKSLPANQRFTALMKQTLRADIVLQRPTTRLTPIANAVLPQGRSQAKSGAQGLKAQSSPSAPPQAAPDEKLPIPGEVPSDLPAAVYSPVDPDKAVAPAFSVVADTGPLSVIHSAPELAVAQPGQAPSEAPASTDPSVWARMYAGMRRGVTNAPHAIGEFVNFWANLAADQAISWTHRMTPYAHARINGNTIHGHLRVFSNDGLALDDPNHHATVSAFIDHENANPKAVSGDIDTFSEQLWIAKQGISTYSNDSVALAYGEALARNMPMLNSAWYASDLTQALFQGDYEKLGELGANGVFQAVLLGVVPRTMSFTGRMGGKVVGKLRGPWLKGAVPTPVPAPALPPLRVPLWVRPQIGWYQISAASNANLRPLSSDLIGLRGDAYQAEEDARLVKQFALSPEFRKTAMLESLRFSTTQNNLCDFGGRALHQAFMLWGVPRLIGSSPALAAAVKDDLITFEMGRQICSSVALAAGSAVDAYDVSKGRVGRVNGATSYDEVAINYARDFTNAAIINGASFGACKLVHWAGDGEWLRPVFRNYYRSVLVGSFEFALANTARGVEATLSEVAGSHTFNPFYKPGEENAWFPFLVGSMAALQAGYALADPNTQIVLGWKQRAPWQLRSVFWGASRIAAGYARDSARLLFNEQNMAKEKPLALGAPRPADGTSPNGGLLDDSMRLNPLSIIGRAPSSRPYRSDAVQ